MKKFLLLVFAFLIFPYFVSAADKVEINTAPLEQLDEIIGIGPALAQRIIDTRPFSSVDDLIRVKGIGEKTLQKIKDQGLAYVKDSGGTEAESTEEVRPLQKLEEEAKEVGPPLTYPSGIIFNEILPSPEGPDAEEEWTVPTNEPKTSAFS